MTFEIAEIIESEQANRARLGLDFNSAGRGSAFSKRIVPSGCTRHVVDCESPFTNARAAIVRLSLLEEKFGAKILGRKNLSISPLSSGSDSESLICRTSTVNGGVKRRLYHSLSAKILSGSAFFRSHFATGRRYTRPFSALIWAREYILNLS